MIRRIRDEGYFKSMEELGLQLAKDKEIVKQILLKE
jgi:FAD synthase